MAEKLPLVLDLMFPLNPRYDEHQPADTLLGGEGPCRAYADALAKEIASAAPDFEDYEVAAVRLHGGSPSMMGGTQLRNVMKAVRNGFSLVDEPEFLLQTGARQLSADLLASRLSCFKIVLEFDAVSAMGKELRALGSRFDFGSFLDMLELLKCMNIKEFSFDLRYGLFFQTEKSMREGLDEVFKTAAPRLALLPYTMRPAGECAQLVEKGELSLPSAEEAAALFAVGDSLIKEGGYEPYARGRYAHPGHESAWWKAYREGAAVLGCGLGAHSSFEEFESDNTRNFKVYVEHSEDIEAVCARSVVLDEAGVAAERAARLLA